MNTFFHAYRTSVCRYRLEIALWMLLSLLCTCCVASERLDHGANLATVGLSVLEGLGFCWLVLRIGLSEPVFLTQGGWRVRPIERLPMSWLPSVLLVSVLLPAVLLRLWCVQVQVGPSAGQWMEILADNLLTPLTLLALLSLGAWAVGGFIPHFLPGWGRKIAIGAAALATAGIGFELKHPSSQTWEIANCRMNGPINTHPKPLESIARDMLPRDARFIEEESPVHSPRRAGPPLIESRLLLSIPLVEGGKVEIPGIRGRISKVRMAKGAVSFQFELLCGTRRLAEETVNPILIVHLGDGHYSACFNLNETAAPASILLSPVSVRTFTGEAPSPLVLPANTSTPEDFLPGSELLVFVANAGAKPNLPQPGAPSADPPYPPPQIPSDSPDPLERIAVDAMNRCDYLADYGVTPDESSNARQLPAGLMPYLLKRPVWSDAVWRGVVKPYLLEHATVVEKPALLERMTADPRLGEICLSKGWKTDAMPLLKGFAKERISLDLENLKALAAEKDPALTGDISALAMRLGGEVAELEQPLKALPGMDWPVFAKAAWKREKYMLTPHESRPVFAWWAAREGDAPAFRWLAEAAARGDETALVQVKSLVNTNDTDVLAFLRKHLEEVSWKPEVEKFGMR